MARLWVIGLLASLLAPAQTRDVQVIRVQRRWALVVGNSAYPNSPLKNPVNDAADLSASLSRLGFQVTPKTNLTRRGFEQALNEFTRQVSAGDLALVYFAGHGVQVENENYLVPVDFNAESEADVPYEAFAASRLRSRLEATGAAVRVLILDACRNNPFKFKRSGMGGLAAMTMAAEGTIIAFAAGDNQTADDNRVERNGLYTKFLLQALEQPGAHLKDVFERTRAQVYEASGRKQFPALYDMVVGRLILKEGSPAAASTATPMVNPPGSTVNEEDVYWRQCESAKGAFCEAYVERFPQGRFVRLAKLIIGPVSSPSPASLIKPTVPQPGKTRVGRDGLTYVWIPPGEFRMGCSPGDNECDDDEKPARNVVIARGFWMGQTEVTQEAFKQWTGTNPSHFQGGKLPVENINWNQAKSYCEGVGLRLPTAEEWEYAARAGSRGSRYGQLDRTAWYHDNSEKKTSEIASKAANDWGLYDMLGNVWEWTATRYDARTYELRGGAWNLYSGDLRASNRLGYVPEGRDYIVGFRCVGE